MVTLQSVQGCTGLSHHFLFFDIWALWHSVPGTRLAKCQNIIKGVLDQYDPKRSERIIFATVRKNVGTKGLNQALVLLALVSCILAVICNRCIGFVL